MLSNVTITSAAENFMRRVVRFAGLPAGAGFRLVMSAGGCRGHTAEFTAEPALQPGEQELDIDGLREFLPAVSRLMLEGITIDFADTPTRSGLIFVNPNRAACGCSSAESVPPGEATIDVSAIGLGRPPLPRQIS
ncbi:hypothetical protein LMG28727_07315 [Paraburkholderia kirstenboschensis]|uniref:HesB/IscA family protein n=1 Tax=Paraburkholderia kirstenboschensis TaxID=1245436 RepID=UPI000B04112D|nr:IscN protein [Paraburkholderia kirstenboschensis]CAD6561022.1 hypothetical protein LMG28727_07315 [Paraburkholderia kirstenboschensis]